MKTFECHTIYDLFSDDQFWCDNAWTPWTSTVRIFQQCFDFLGCYNSRTIIFHKMAAIRRQGR